MEDNGDNLLDALDALRELPPKQQLLKIKGYSLEQQEMLNEWLAAEDNSPNPFEIPVLVRAEGDANDSPQNGDETADNSATADISPGTTQVSAVKSTRRRPVDKATTNRAISFKSGDILLRQFRIIEHVGDGGMGQVFRAVDENTDERIALKFLPIDRLSANTLRLLKNEIRLAHRVRSQYVCALHGLHIDPAMDSSDTPVPPFITMQFVEGEDLSRLIKRIGRLAGPKVLRIAYELAKGLSAIHEAGILHCDLKPSNVMLDQHGVVQILDFRRHGRDIPRRVG